MVNNHGDRFCPKFLGLFPLQMVFSWLVNGGDPNYLHPLGAHPPSWGENRESNPVNPWRMGSHFSAPTKRPYKYHGVFLGFFNLAYRGQTTPFITGYLEDGLPSGWRKW